MSGYDVGSLRFITTPNGKALRSTATVTRLQNHGSYTDMINGTVAKPLRISWRQSQQRYGRRDEAGRRNETSRRSRAPNLRQLPIRRTAWRTSKRSAAETRAGFRATRTGRHPKPTVSFTVSQPTLTSAFANAPGAMRATPTASPPIVPPMAFRGVAGGVPCRCDHTGYQSSNTCCSIEGQVAPQVAPTESVATKQLSVGKGGSGSETQRVPITKLPPLACVVVIIRKVLSRVTAERRMVSPSMLSAHIARQ